MEKHNLTLRSVYSFTGIVVLALAWPTLDAVEYEYGEIRIRLLADELGRQRGRVDTVTEGTIKVDEVVLCADHTCYRPVVDEPFSFKYSDELEMLPVNTVRKGVLFDFEVFGQTLAHEAWHRSHHAGIAQVVYQPLEDWSASYSGNLFTSPDEAQAAGEADFDAALVQAAELEVLWQDKSTKHFGAADVIVDGATAEVKKTPAGTKVYRLPKFDWGGPLMSRIQAIEVAFETTPGTCVVKAKPVEGAGKGFFVPPQKFPAVFMPDVLGINSYVCYLLDQSHNFNGKLLKQANQ